MSRHHPVRPPLDGTLRILPGFVDFHAAHNPEFPFILFPDGDSCTFKEFADATHRIAHILRPQLSGPDRETIAMVIHCDTVLYYAVLVGAVRAGLIPFPMSPRNTPAAVAKMLQNTDCRRVIHHAPFHVLTAAVRAALPEGYALQVDELVALGQAFPKYGEGPQSSPVSPYPLPREPLTNDDVMLYLHSSGSTGFPKSIPQSVLSVLHWAHSDLIKNTLKHGLRWGCPAVPTFHTMGMLLLYATLASGLSLTLYAPRGHLNMPPPVPTAQNVLEACQATNVNAVVSVPSLLEEWAHDKAGIDYLKTLDALLFAGGPLSQSSGDKLTEAGVRLFALYGATEFGPTTRIFDCVEDMPDDADVINLGKTRKDWQWMSFASSHNIHWEPQENGTFELILLDCPTHRLSVLNLTTGEKGYATSDLWERHPTKPDLWRITGRSDDVIVFGNGEKLVPISQEGHVTAHPMVMGAVMFGRGREQPGILVEPRQQYGVRSGDEEALVNFRNAIWPQVEEANETAPAWGRVFKEMILLADLERPFPRAGKGTVQRKLALASYEKDIEQLYETIANSADAAGVSPPSNWSTLEVQVWLSEHVAKLNHGVAVSPDEDLFANGLDSLSATFLRNRIIGTFRSSHDAEAQAAVRHISSSFIFKHPTITQIATALSSFVRLGSDTAHSVSDPVVEIEAMIAKYTAMLPPAATLTKPSEGAIVMVTGTTGALGSHLVAYLLANSRVRKVYALNRGTNVAERQREAFEDALLPIHLLSDPKLVLLEGDIMRDDLGLTADVLQDVRSTVTDIIQNAWRVDFNLSLASFEPYVGASIRLVTLAPNARFFFVSSIAAVSRWRVLERGAVPEEPIHNPSVAAGLGYGASKYVVEEVIAKAREKGLATTTLRVGQIAGSSISGSWNINEWVPSLVKSSISLGYLPDLEGDAAWVPMDAVGHAIVDVVLNVEPPSCINIVHPKPISASQIMKELAELLGLKRQLVPTAQWVQHLENVAKNALEKDLETTPAIKLLDFFRAIASAEGSDSAQTFETQKAQASSPTMAGLSPLGRQAVGAWVTYWRSKKFLS